MVGVIRGVTVDGLTLACYINWHGTLSACLFLMGSSYPACPAGVLTFIHAVDRLPDLLALGWVWLVESSVGEGVGTRVLFFS